MNTITQRLNEIISYSGLSVRAFAIKCGLHQATIDKQIKGLRSVSVETLVGVLQAYPEISAEWLMRGTGSMMTPQGYSSIGIARINELIATLANATNEIALQAERIKAATNSIEK